jgi:hypothetical protein
MVALKGREFTAKIMMFTSYSLMMTNWALWPLMFWCLWKFDADGRHGRKFFSTNKKLILGTCIMEFYVLSLINHPIKCCCTIFWSYLENPVRNMAAYRKSNKKNTLCWKYIYIALTCRLCRESISKFIRSGPL